MGEVDGSRARAADGGAAAGGERLAGIILGFPERVARELKAWRASFGDPLAEVIPAHITLVTTTLTQDWDETVRHVREVAARAVPFRVGLDGTGSFRPVSPVVYVQVKEGFEECVRLHAELQRGPLERELPFPYHPHVTVAHDVPEERLEEAEAALSSYSESFTVASMGLYEHDAGGFWKLREELEFGASTDRASGSGRAG
ncbi:2'-5' RNA ligase family protein [Sinomonas halotolerans]|uniref:2'-5' RNA ligase family protein n=1 Tax=Sinomonas halotolerans TaxID=1644133 RepID=A0ABU9WUR3_9MICC